MARGPVSLFAKRARCASSGESVDAIVLYFIGHRASGHGHRPGHSHGRSAACLSIWFLLTKWAVLDARGPRGGPILELLWHSVCCTRRVSPFFVQRTAHRSRRGAQVCLYGTVLLGALLLQAAATPHAGRAHLAARQYLHAEKLERRLRAMPQAVRTAREYNAVLDAYRAVYHGDPAAAEAPKSIFAVAALLREKGAQFGNVNDLRSAVGQYEFLRKQYPASSLCGRAVLAEASIERKDLQDAQAAARLDREFLRQWPHSPLAAQARAAWKLDRRNAAHTAPQAIAVRSARVDTGHREIIASTRRSAQPTVASTGKQRGTSASAGMQRTVGAAPGAKAVADVRPVSVSQAAPVRPGPPPATLQGVRYWSTEGHTRVALDLDHAVAYSSAQGEGTSRVVYRLANTVLSGDLPQRPMEVNNDPFLREIRVTAGPANTAEVELDVRPSSTSSAFLLPDPDRLVIDLHTGPPYRAKTTVPTPLVAHAAPERPATSAQPAPERTASGAVLEDASRPSAAATAGPGPLARPAVPFPEAPALRATSGTPSPPAFNARTDAPATGPTLSPSPIAARVDVNRPVTTASGDGGSGPIGRTAGAMSAHDGPLMAQASAGGSLSRVLGLKVHRIVIDAGHGGHDSGTLGPHGLEEKNVVLDVALRLGKLLEQRLGAEVVYTRRDDTFVPLQERTAIANQAHADLFLSIHANSSRDHSARGVETYFLDFTSSPGALAVAERENAVSDRPEYELSSLVRRIALNDKMDESRTFAMDVQQSLYEGLEKGNPGLRDRGVKRAPFVVLIGANMPSILAEISFLTNPKDANQLRKPAYRQRIAEALYQGVADYVESMGGVRVAENTQTAGR